MNAELDSADPAPAGAGPSRALGRLRRRAAQPQAASRSTWSLQAQLRGHLLGLMATVWLLAAGAAGFGLWARTGEVLDSALQETAERLLMLPEAALATPDSAARLALPQPHDEVLAYQVLDRQLGLVLRSHRAPQTPLDPDAPDGLRQAGRWLVLTLSSPDGSRRAQVAETLAHRHAGLWAGVGWLLGVLAALLGAAWLTMDWLLRRGFDSLEPARRELAQRPLHDLRPLVVHQAPAELQPWLVTVNCLLSRVASLVDSERAFAANTAHELRTPLAAARGQAQRLAQASTDARTREQAQVLVRQLDRLSKLATRLLQLAQVESGVALRREPVDLVQLAVLVIDEFTDATRSGQLQLQVRGASVPVHGDVDALGIALRNLIDNALKHGGCGSRVVVTVAGQQLVVQDDGPGVAPALLDGLVRPFNRGGPGHALQGSGLGLAMVETIARQSGARLALLSPVADGQGFAATLDFNADSPGR